MLQGYLSERSQLQLPHKRDFKDILFIIFQFRALTSYEYKSLY